MIDQARVNPPIHYKYEPAQLLDEPLPPSKGKRPQTTGTLLKSDQQGETVMDRT